MSSTTTSDPTAQQGTPETSAGTFVPVQTRSERFASGNPDDFAPVQGFEPEWKLTPVARLRPLLDGILEGSQYPVSFEETAGVQVTWVKAEDCERGVAGLAEDKLAANAWSQTTEVLQVEIQSDLEQPFVLSRDGLGENPRAAHTLIRVRENAHATLVLHSLGDAVLAENVEFDLRQGSSLTVVITGEWNAGSLQYAQHFATLGKDASLTHIAVSLGGDVVIVSPSVQLVGPGSEAHLWGAYFADSTQHLEHRVYVHHQGPKTVSRVTYKGALHGTGARTVWIGDVLIGADAVGTDSYEQNRNLVLSEGTRADSIPNLEIKTGDIQGAGHASATGRFDDEQLFYLQSRGIEEVDARRLVVMGFLVEVISKIPLPALVEDLTAKITNKLSKTEDAL
jgi:Fe-S cluster assembly protein SufD